MSAFFTRNPAQPGQYHTLRVKKFSPHGPFLEAGDLEILLPRGLAPEGLEIGHEIEVFVFRDSEDRITATTEKPLALADEMAVMDIKEVNSVGAFAAWGLTKDLLIPYAEQTVKLLAGDRVLVRVLFDPRSDRLIGSTKVRDFLEEDLTGKYTENQEVKLVIYGKTEAGFLCAIDGKFSGLLFHSDAFRPLEIGESCTGYIKKIREEDGKADLSLRLPGYDGIRSETEQILDKLKSGGGRLPFSDSSSPESIRENFGMSKKTFKKLIGTLYRSGKIVIEEKEIRLAEPKK